MGDERVALYDLAARRPVGAAPRSAVRRQNLPHASTAVLLQDPAGRVYVHRRTVTKDVYPGAYDCWAGGVVLAGEDPTRAAARELAEELGVTGVLLRELATTVYEDEVTRYVAFAYQATHDGPVRHQPEEVAWGAWWPLVRLLDRLRDPAWPFVPDGRALLVQCLGQGVLGFAGVDQPTRWTDEA